MQWFKDTSEAGKIFGEDGEKIMHISLPMGENILMATDALESLGQKLEPGSSIYFPSILILRLMPGKSLIDSPMGGRVEMELQDTFLGTLFGSLSDKYGAN